MIPDTVARTLPVDAVAVWLDETRYYNIAQEDRQYIEKIIGVYVFDRNEHTYCCELTPSYDLRHVYNSVVTTLDTPDDVRDRISETYEYCGGEDNYFHVRVIDALPAEHTRDYGKFDENDLEEAIEYFRGNCPF